MAVGRGVIRNRPRGAVRDTYVCASQFGDDVVVVDRREETAEAVDDVLQCIVDGDGDGHRDLADAVGFARADGAGDGGDDAAQAAEHAEHQLDDGQQQCEDLIGDAAQLFQQRVLHDRIQKANECLDLACEVGQLGAEVGQQSGSGGGDGAHNLRNGQSDCADEILQLGQRIENVDAGGCWLRLLILSSDCPRFPRLPSSTYLDEADHHDAQCENGNALHFASDLLPLSELNDWIRLICF